MNLDTANSANPHAAAGEPAPASQALTRRDNHFYEELSRINNELANLQRELARTNAELAAAQEKLKAGEQRYRSLIACSPIGIFEWDASGRCIYTNAHWQAISGLTAEESLGDGWQRSLDQRDAPDYLNERKLAFHTCQEFNREVRFVHTSGDQRWAQVRSRAILAEDGQAAGRVSTVEDITERKKSENELRWTTGLLESQVNNSIDGILVTDTQGRKIVQNQRMADLFKIPPAIAADQDDRPQLEWVSNRNVDPEQFLARVTYLYNHPGEISRDEIELKDQTFLDRYTSPVTGSDGTHYGRLWTFRDITARKRVEMALRDSERRMRLQTAALEACANGVAITNIKGTIEWVNEAFTRLTGYAAIELLGQNPRILKSGKQSDSFYKELWQTICQGRVWFGEIINRHRSGRLYYEEMTITPVRDEGGRITHFISVKQDITERKRAGEVLQEQLALRDRLAKIAAATPGIIYSFRLRPDGTNCLPYASPTIEEFLGVRAEDLESDASPLLNQILPEDKSDMDGSIAESARTMQPWRAEFRARHPKRGLFWVEAQSTPEREADGSIIWYGFMSDISDRKRTEELLRRSEEKFRGLVENLRDAMLTLSPETKKFTSANPAAIKMFGARNEAELISFGPAELSPERQPDGKLSVEQAANRTAALKEGPQRFEWVHRRISGVEFFAEVMLTVMERDGKPTVLASIRDITERKQAEETLREKEHMLSESQRLGHIGSWFGDLTGPLSWSEEAYRIYGVSPDTFIPAMESLLGLILPDDRPVILDWQTRCAAGQKPGEIEFRIQRPDGSVRFIKRNGEAVYDADNRFIHMAGTVQDITERRMLEARLEQQRAEREIILSSIGDGVHWLGPDGLIKYENPAAAKMLGYDNAELLGRPAHVTMHHKRPDGSVYPIGECPIYATLHDRVVRHVTNEVFWRKDGTSFDVDYNCTPVYESDGRSGGTVVTFVDTTERKRAQAERDNLERQVAEHRANEESARLALTHQQKLSQLQSRFVSMVSHEFRTPLCVINMAAQLLDGYMEKMSGQERSEQLKEIQQSVERMTQMMNDFLVYGNCSAGKMECKPSRIDLGALCRQNIAEIPRYAGSPSPIEVAIDSTVTRAWLDKKILHHILGNLLSNAVKYSSGGRPVTLQATRVAGDSQLAGNAEEPREAQVEITVTDTGIGIPASDLGRVFDSFHRAANVGNVPGTGMGLAIVKQFVDLHRGTIRVSSELGKGTTVWVRLPIAAPDTAVVPNAPGALEQPGAGPVPDREWE